LLLRRGENTQVLTQPALRTHSHQVKLLAQTGQLRGGAAGGGVLAQLRAIVAEVQLIVSTDG
jgi:hypothetical protein